MPTTTIHPSRPPVWIRLPALAAILLCAFMGVSILRWNPTAVGARYESIARKALKSGDYQTAYVAGNRLMGLGGNSRNHGLFLLAMADLGLGRPGDASAIFQMLAPLETPVYAPAHIYMARMIMARGNPYPQAEQAALKHIMNAFALEPDSSEAKDAFAAYQQWKRPVWP